MRLFVAAELPASIRARLAAAQSTLRALPIEARWVRPEGMHLTFVFLGEVLAARLQGIVAALAGLAGAPPGPIGLEARGLGGFPESGRLRVIWAGIAGDLAALRRLQESVAAALRAGGFAGDDRPYHPHLTLARVQGGRGDAARAALRSQSDTGFGSFAIEAVHLFESRLLPGGAEYRSLKAFPLSAAGSTS